MSDPRALSAESHSTDATSAPYARPALARRRDKPQLSCHHCRRRKLRCDRQQPTCSNCASRGSECMYASQHENSSLRNPGSNLQDRLDHLENLVTSLMTRSGHGAVKPPPSSAGSTPSRISDADVGSMNARASDLPYVGGDHWAAILESIEDLKDQLSHEEEMKQLEHMDSASPVNTQSRVLSQHSLLLYGVSHASLEEIIAALPARDVIDRYLACYFNRLGLAYYVVHAPSFLRQYQSFWRDPSGTPVTWIGLLYSMICMALLASEPPDNNEVNFYCEKIVQCLVLGEYTRAGPHTLETLMHYMHIEFSRNVDAGADLWFLLGVTVNLAMRAGYHRDPSNFSTSYDQSWSATLQNEMRRRIWASVLLGDVVISSQMGMPSMISESQWDTREPLNLDDLDTEGEDVRQPRAETEYTRVLSIIAGRRVSIVVGAISAATSKSGLDYAQVMHLDNRLNKAGDIIPPVLKIRSMEASIVDTPQMIMSRLFIAHIFFKGKLMLHRRSLYASEAASRSAGSTGEHEYSRKACISASLDILDIQRILHEETQPGGQLEPMRWRVSSVMNHQFLIATTILCSVLCRKIWLSPEEDGIVKRALRKAGLIWKQTMSTSKEATRAMQAIRAVLPTGTDDRGFWDTGIDEVGSTSTRGNFRNRSARPGVAIGQEAMDTSEEISQPSVDEILGQMGRDPLFDDWFLTDGPGA